MRLRPALHALFSAPDDDPELAHAQLTVIARHLPLLLIILTANAVTLAATHIRTAPPFLTLAMPAVFCLICYRRVQFWRRLELEALDGAAALERMKSVMRNIPAYGVVFTAWSLALYPYGDSYARCHVAFYMASTVLSSLFCLNHLRGTAILLTGIVFVPYTIFFLLTGNIVLIAMVANLYLLAGCLIVVVLRNYQDFAGRVISQRDTKRLSDENLRLAQLDGLTGLPNRGRFLAELDDVLTASRASGVNFAIAIIDLDRFKSVNDMYGHAAGDRLLAQVGDRLARIAGPQLFLGRLGGDEFGAILKSVPDEAAIMAFCARAQALLAPEFAISSQGFASIGCSVGAAIYPQSGQTANELFEHADYALYDGKQRHRGETVLFSQRLATEIGRSSQIEQSLRNAHLQTELSLVFQPIFDLTTNKTRAFEALVRWNSPELGIVSPGEFIPIAERAQLINGITKILFAKALDAVAVLPDKLRLGFNLSAHDLNSPATMAEIQSMLGRSGIRPDRLAFEITEGALLQNVDYAAEMLGRLGALGSRIVLDDFGVGYSSLGYIHRLKLDKIKTDRSFVEDLERSATAPKLIGAILNLCRNLGIDCTIEGVETPQQLAILRGLGARSVQGYLFAKPMPLESVPAFLAREMTQEPAARPAPQQRRRTRMTS